MTEEERELLAEAIAHQGHCASLDCPPDKITPAVERILVARAGLSPEAVREREAAAFDACALMASSCGWLRDLEYADLRARNPYRSADR